MHSGRFNLKCRDPRGACPNFQTMQHATEYCTERRFRILTSVCPAIKWLTLTHAGRWKIVMSNICTAVSERDYCISAESPEPCGYCIDYLGRPDRLCARTRVFFCQRCYHVEGRLIWL